MRPTRAIEQVLAGMSPPVLQGKRYNQALSTAMVQEVTRLQAYNSKNKAVFRWYWIRITRSNQNM